jgi:hypothetical protein
VKDTLVPDGAESVNGEVDIWRRRCLAAAEKGSYPADSHPPTSVYLSVCLVRQESMHTAYRRTGADGNAHAHGEGDRSSNMDKAV